MNKTIFAYHRLHIPTNTQVTLRMGFDLPRSEAIDTMLHTMNVLNQTTPDYKYWADINILEVPVDKAA